jgi:magnesium chelatase subunit I
MINPGEVSILPYHHVVGQADVKLALELNYIAPRIGGVLISGQRGTAKSTVVRAFSLMTCDKLPVTLPINATDDRVVGGWELDALMQGKAKEQVGLLEEANGGLLYVDEVNLLDDHIVNIILDVASTGVLTVQREAADRVKHINFGLVGTMNPEEGGLRPQLLDRFGLMVTASELEPALRQAMVSAVLRFDEEMGRSDSRWIKEGLESDIRHRSTLEYAREGVHKVLVSSQVAKLCADVAAQFKAVGHRGEVVMALAARALAARGGFDEVGFQHVGKVAPMALRHRRHDAAHGGPAEWTEDDSAFLDSILSEARRQ